MVHRHFGGLNPPQTARLCQRLAAIIGDLEVLSEERQGVLDHGELGNPRWIYY